MIPALTPAEWTVLLLSLKVSLVAVGAMLPPAFALAWLLARGRFPGRDLLNAACLSPLMIPALVMGVAAFHFSLVIWDHLGLTLGGTVAGLVMGHLTFAVPFVVK